MFDATGKGGLATRANGAANLQTNIYQRELYSWVRVVTRNERKYIHLKIV